MASIGRALLVCLAQLHTILYISSAQHAHGAGNLPHLSVPFLCHPDQANLLLQLKKSFSFAESTTRLSSWRDGTDCCLWEGVGCDASSGNVTILDLNNRGLSSNGFDPAIFSLTSLRRLDLSMNDFSEAQLDYIPLQDDFFLGSRFESFTLLTHLNLSCSGLYGQIPTGIRKLVNLLSLDLSSDFTDDNEYIDYYEWESSFDITLVANLSNLRELYLDGVDLSSSGQEWGASLATSSPHLQVLSLPHCRLSGIIHESLSSLRSLVVINLKGNFDITAGPFPEFFMDFLNLTVLRLSNVNLEGWFPSRSFQSKNLKVLDLSNNQDLSGHFPNLSNASSLETLRLDLTNFTYARPVSSSNFKLLKDLSLDGNFFSKDFLSLFGILGSLCQLDLSLDSVSEFGSIFSWIGDHKNLTSLTLSGCNFSRMMPYFDGNFKALRSLTMFYCNLPMPVLHAVGNLMGLQALEMHGCTTDGSIPSSISNLTNLRDMYIDGGFSGHPMPAAIGKLTNLRNMYIYNCWFSGPMPSAIGNLTNLRNMNLEIPYDGFSGPMPATIGQLTNLRNMFITTSGFSGPMPTAIGNLTNLRNMHISQNSWSSIPYTIGQLSELTWLSLPDCNISGSIPSSIVNLTQLTELDLSHNSLTGEIQSRIFNLPELRHLDLSFNQLSGPLQVFDVAAPRLESVDLGNNALSGLIPEAIFQPTSLVRIDVSSNNLIGSVDLSHLCRLSELVSLDLSNNKLHVLDNADGNCSLATSFAGFRKLGLASCNMTRFPRFLRHLNYISYLDLSHNKISGDVPNWIWETWSGSLFHLNLSHNMFTGMQLTSGVLPFTTLLQVFDLSFNRLTGQIPMPNSSAEILEYSNNRFSSLLPNWATYLTGGTRYLRMSKNNLNGYVPHLICNSTLDVLDLSYNKFSGRIPSCLIENMPLMVLNLRENHFEGTLPSNITSACCVQTIDLHGNMIEGKLPRGLSNCSSLEVLDLGGNRIRDTFPSWLRWLPELSVLILRSNQLYGTIGDIIGDNKSDKCFPSLQIIDLASNNFSGYLRPQWFKLLKSMMAASNTSGKTLSIGFFRQPDEFYQDFTEITYKGSDVKFDRILTTLTSIDFSNNRLEGNIPESIGRLVSLRLLNTSHNAFTGNIPAELGGMTALESLDLSCNQLSGEIPQELTDLTFLDVLNLSDNHLVGKIPQSRQFSTFDSNSFEGNAGLCGPPLSNLPCGASPHTPGAAQVDKPFHHVDVVLFLFAGLGFGVGFAAAILVRWNRVCRWFVATARACRT